MTESFGTQGGPQNAPPAGWYPAPDGDGQRWWDGGQWGPPAAAGQQWSSAPNGQPYQGVHPMMPPPGQQWTTQRSFPPQGDASGSGDSQNVLSIIGIVCGAIAFLLFPIILGPAGLILGGIAMSKKEKLAPVALAVAGAGLIVGMVLGVLVAS